MELLKARGGMGKTREEKDREEEDLLLRHVTLSRQPLAGRKQVAGAEERSSKRMETGWQPPRLARSLTIADCDEIRGKWGIEVTGDDIPPPLLKFSHMRLPAPILTALENKGIANPTPIQIQGLPVVLAGRDMIGVAFTGSGKSMVFTLPLIMFALQQELRAPLRKSEGPIGLVLVPQRELASQTAEGFRYFTEALVKGGMTQLNTLLVIGGVDMKTQWEMVPQNAGIHIVVATPGRLTDLLEKRRIILNRCIYLAMDEADRLVDDKFEDNMRSIFDAFSGPRQTVLFSATMPPKVQQFALTALVDPITVSVGRAGAANLDVIQEVEAVKPELKINYLLECLQKTPPPVVVFANSQRAVDEVTEYLMIRGVDAVSVHGGIEQNERLRAISDFRGGKADVLVATDVASKGLDFPNIQHVINFDMPKEIEDYIHRIGRTGRSGKTGVATSFINRDSKEEFLLDLKSLLKEAKQRIPPMLEVLEDPRDLVESGYENKSCELCGGLGHRALRCPKLAKKNASKIRNNYGFDIDESSY